MTLPPHCGDAYDAILENLQWCAGRALGPKERHANRAVLERLGAALERGDVAVHADVRAAVAPRGVWGADEVGRLFAELDAQQWSTADTVYRHLASQHWNVDRTVGKLGKWLEWRAANAMPTLLDEEFPDELASVFNSGQYGLCPGGFPIYWDKPDPAALGPVVARDPERARRFQMWSIEWARWRASQRLQRTPWTQASLDAVHRRGGGTAVVDVSPLDWHVLAHRPLMHFWQDLQAMLNDMQPESVAQLWYVNAPWYYSAMWACFKPFVSEWIAKKVRIVRPPNTLKELGEELGLANVPPGWGGEGTAPWVPIAEQHRRYVRAKRTPAGPAWRDEA